MSNTITSPNMNLPIPVTNTDPGPDYANNVNASLMQIDSHNHSSGQGVQIQPSGLNINADLTFNNNNATNLRTLRFFPQGSTPSGPSDLGCLTEIGVDLYYIDGSGNVVRITQSGGIAGTNGSIGGLTSPASATYVSATPAFVFQSNVNTPADLDGGSLVLRNITANSNGITLNAPNALASNYSLTLPAALPGATSILQLASSGNISASNTVPAPITLGSGGVQLSSNSGGLLTNGAVYPGSSSNAFLIGFTANTISVGSVSISNNLPIVVSATPSTNGLMIVRGNIQANATIISGEGFNFVSHPSTGQYVIAFTTAFIDTPAVSGVSAAGNATTFSVNSLSSTAFHVFLSQSGTPVDEPFSFIVIGQRQN